MVELVDSVPHLSLLKPFKVPVRWSEDTQEEIDESMLDRIKAQQSKSKGSGSSSVNTPSCKESWKDKYKGRIDYLETQDCQLRII